MAEALPHRGVKAPKRPEGWVPPGPRPRAPADLLPADDEDLSLLCGDFRIFQKRKGHRWSLDDLVTGWTARRVMAERPPRDALDLGCGLGSVAMQVAWTFPEARVTGVEAQDVSFELATRSVRWNGVDDRVTLVHGDLRDASVLPEGAGFDLVTGTPPYFVRGQALESEHVQCAPCRFELRGGPEDYALAAARWMRPEGRFVICVSVLQRDRVREAARAARLDVTEVVDVIPRDGKDALVLLAVMRHGDGAWPAEAQRLVVRSRDHQWTDAFRAVRRDMGMPDLAPPAA